MTADIHIAGEGCRLSLRLTRWEYPELTSGSDANWVVGEVELMAGSGGRFTARQPVYIRTDEISRFHDELAALIESLSGDARLEHIENQFGAKVTLDNGVGVLAVYIREHVGAELRVTDVRTDQSFLRQTAEDLQRAVAAFGVRGQPYG